MRVSFSFGGGPHRHRGSRHGRHHHGPGISIGMNLGPIGSAIVSLIFAVIGIFVLSISFGNFIMLIIGALFCVVGISGFVTNIKKAKNAKNNDSSLDE